MVRPFKDEMARRVGLEILARGLMTPRDVAQVSGLSRQVVDHWVKSTGVNWRAAYQARISAAWNSAMKGPAKPERKARMRRVATKAKGDWDARQRPGYALPHEAPDPMPEMQAYGSAGDVARRRGKAQVF